MSLAPSESPAEGGPLVQSTTIGHFNASQRDVPNPPGSVVYLEKMGPKDEKISTRQRGVDCRHRERTEGTPRRFISGRRLAEPSR